MAIVRVCPINHTGTMDLLYTHQNATALGKQTLESALGGSPLQVPFAYERVSPYILDATINADLNRSPIRNIKNIPFYVHINLVLALPLRQYLNLMPQLDQSQAKVFQKHRYPAWHGRKIVSQQQYFQYSIPLT